MYDHWRDIVTEAVEERGGIVRIGPTVFNKHVSLLRDDYDVKTIRDGFRRFAEMVRAGKIDVRGKPAWFVFYGRRETFIRVVGPVKTLGEMERKPMRTLADAERKPVRTLGDIKREQG